MSNTNKQESEKDSPWYIFIPGGKYAYVIGRTGQYETELSDAMSFYEWNDAAIYVEKHGYDRIATIRKVKL